MTTALDAVWGPLTGARARIAVDPTDLVALPLALLAVRYGRWRAGRADGGAS